MTRETVSGALTCCCFQLPNLWSWVVVVVGVPALLCQTDPHGLGSVSAETARQKGR